MRLPVHFRRFAPAALGAAAALLAVTLTAQQNQNKQANHDLGFDDTPVIPGQKWKVHDIARPHPRVVTPGAKPGDAPSDAIVLFDGKDLSQWLNSKGGKTSEAAWKLGDGWMEVNPGTGDLITKQKFGDAQFHVEWASPAVVKGNSQARANSGFLIMSRYEIQILDTYNNGTYADGGAGAIYGQWPPLVNACRKPGEWQTYDIVFEAPRFDAGKLVKAAFVTVFHNGVVLHNRKEIQGPMAYRKFTPYTPHAAEEPLMLQDHHDPVRYRNIWVRPLKGYDQP